MTSIDYELAQTYEKLFQLVQQMDQYLDDYEQSLEEITNESMKRQANDEFLMLDCFVENTARMLNIVYKYRALNPYGSENARLRDQLWKAKEYIRTLGGDWNTVLWTNKLDY